MLGTFNVNCFLWFPDDHDECHWSLLEFWIRLSDGSCCYIIWCHCTSLYRFLSYAPWSYGYGVKWSVWPQVQANLKMKLPTLGSRKSRCVVIQWHFFFCFFSIAKRSCAVQSLRPWFWRRNSDGEKLWKAKLGCTGRPSKSSKSPAVT